MGIQPEYVSLATLLHLRLFVVPEFQRAYSWQKKHRDALFKDLRALEMNADANRHHFMATVVFLQTDQKEEVGAFAHQVLHVVDGQQRLTSLVILLKALAKRMRSTNGNDMPDTATQIEDLLVKKDGHLHILQTNHDVYN